MGLFGVVFLAILVSQQQNGSPQRMYHLAWVLNRLALVLLFIGCASFVWAVKSRQDAFTPPATPVAPSAFSQTDLTGALNEVLIHGHIQLDDMQAVLFARDVWLLNRDTTVIPITDPNWRRGDPVKLFLVPRAFDIKSPPDELAAGLASEGIVTDGAVVMPQTHLMAQAELYSFKGDVTQALRAAGFNTAPQAYLLEIIEGRRDQLLDKALTGPMSVAYLMGGLGLVLLLGSMAIKGWVRMKFPGLKG